MRAYDIILHRATVGNVYNIASSDEFSIIQVADYLLKQYQKSANQFIENVADRPFNDCRYAIKCDKLLALGWKQTVSWQDGIQRTIEWYHKLFASKHNLREKNNYWQTQIDNALTPHPSLLIAEHN